MRKVTGSWLSGPQAALEESPSNFAGEKLGATEHGPGSIATLGRRVGALLIDWLLVSLPTTMILGVDGSWFLGGISTTIPIIWMLLSVSTVWAFSLTPGMAATGQAVGRVDADAPVGLWRAVVRAVLTLCVFPALFQDDDLRGMHDRATGTAVVRTR